ncbi:MAG: tetratricopeptide repeat protein [Methyloceanibacter sp.]|uniref:tetratricopeptide repeat protein n=1 Tax=Methyloceanibacter sp. TaxID=1965321 RepID=UPI003D9B5F53
MVIGDKATLRKWGPRSLLLAAILIAPAAYSEVDLTKSSDADQGTLLGNYLSGRVARGDHDTTAAADFYSAALAGDPANEIIMEQTFLLQAAAADWGRATDLAEQLIKVEPSHRIARFLLGAEAFKKGDYKKADEHFAAARQGPIADLTSTLARAWVQAADNNYDGAMTTLDTLSEADWAQFYQRYHRALIADVAGKRDVAQQAFSEAFKKNPGTLRVAEAYTRHAMVSGNRKLARQILKAHMAEASGHPISQALQAEIESGKVPPLLITSPAQGLAEVFYGIGDALAGEGGLDMGITFLQFALYVEPDFPLAHVALAEAYDGARRYDLELAAFDNIKEDSPLWVSVQIQKAFALNAMERVDDAKAKLDELIAKYPKDIRPLDALGNILRSHERYEEARDYYARAIALLGAPTPDNWSLYYSRGVCNERLKDWPKAEVDFKQALALAPDESLVLNYLGYSWVDQGRNLKTALDYIRKAVKLKPDDGYYVDSLGWAYFRLGNLEGAVEQLERAVELKPDDPVINDHLGDAYWRVGRKLEAKYQWEQALTLKPENEQVTTLKQKIADGLPDKGATQAANRTTQAGGKTPE